MTEITQSEQVKKDNEEAVESIKHHPELSQARANAVTDIIRHMTAPNEFLPGPYLDKIINDEIGRQEDGGDANKNTANRSPNHEVGSALTLALGLYVEDAVDGRAPGRNPMPPELEKAVVAAVKGKMGEREVRGLLQQMVEGEKDITNTKTHPGSAVYEAGLRLLKHVDDRLAAGFQAAVDGDIQAFQHHQPSALPTPALGAILPKSDKGRSQ